jgi:hypothetical protein
MQANRLTVEGRDFELTLLPNRGACHWLLAEPGKVVLSGEERNEEAAFEAAREAAVSWLEAHRAVVLAA